MNFFLKRRKELKLSQFEVAVLLGTTPGTVGWWERDCIAPPLKRVPRIAEVYQVSESRAIKEIVAMSRSINKAKLTAAK